VVDRYGNVYCVVAGTSNRYGAIVRIDPSGVETILHYLAQSEVGIGDSPGSIVIADDGNLYGEMPTGGAAGYGAIFKLTVPPVVQNVSGQVSVTRGGFLKNRATGRFVQTISLKNASGANIIGPTSLVLDALSGNAALFNKSGSTTVTTPSGSPYINATAGSLAAGASVTITLEFTDPTNAAISYSTRVLAGPGSR
jgi:hypothetical protein